MRPICHLLTELCALLAFAIASNAQAPVLAQRAHSASKSSSQCVVTMPQRPAPGAMLVACVGTNAQAGAATISGGGVTQWQLCRSQSSTRSNAQIWVGRVEASPSATCTVTFANSQSRIEASLAEFRGTIGALQFTADGGSGADTAATSTAASAPIATSRGDLVIAMIAAANASEAIPNPKPDWKPIANSATNAAWTACGFLVANAPTSLAMQWEFARAQDYATAVAAFRVGTAPTTAPTRRQHASDELWNVSSLTVQLPNQPLPGSLLVVCHESNSSVDSRLQGGGVTQWTRCVSSAPAIVNSEIWAGIVGPNPTSSITITLGTSPNGAIASVTEWTGMPSPLAFQAELGSGPLGGTSVRTPSVLADPNELVVAMAGIHQGGNTISAQGQGFTELMQGYLPSTGQSAAYRIATQQGPVFTTWQLAYSTRWAAPIVVFGGM
jgi:hypothetical protein